MLATVAPAQVQQQIEETQTLIEQWVNTRELISKERNQWRTEKRLLENRIELFEEELEVLEESIARFEEEASAADQERAELQQEAEQVEGAVSDVRTAIIAYESKIKNLAPYFPPTLREKTDILLGRMPNDPQRTSMTLGQRMAIVAGILNEVDKFNNEIRVVPEIISVGEGSENQIQVQTLYLGLSMAFYVDENQRYAGVKTPAAGEWDTTSRDELAPQISRIIGMYNQNIRPAEWVEVPMQINSVR